MNEHFHRIRFWYDSKPKSVRYAGTGFGMMIITTVLASMSSLGVVMVFAATMGLCGLILFVMGLIYGGIDLYGSFRKKNAIT